MAFDLLTQLRGALTGSYQLFYAHPPSFAFNESTSFLGNVEANTLRITENLTSEPVYSDELGEDAPIDHILMARSIRIRATLQEIDRPAVLRLLYPETYNNAGNAVEPGNPTGGMIVGTLRTSILGSIKMRPLYAAGSLNKRLASATGSNTVGKVLHFYRVGIEPGEDFETALSAGLTRIPVTLLCHPCRSANSNDSKLVYYEYTSSL